MSDKRAKREARKQEKQKKAKARALRDQPEKRPRFLSNPDTRGREYPRWQFSRIDSDHPEWGWQGIAPEKWEDICNKLGQFETMTWGQIEGSDTGSHLVEVASCPNPTTLKRLEELELDDVDTLFSLRLSGPERIFGILDGHTLKLLWFDSNHTVWPTRR